MKINDVLQFLEQWAPLHYAEDFDNVGLLVGDPEAKLSGVLVALDTLENVVEEAIAKNCNLIVGFHPIIFNGLKRLTGKTYVERTLIKAIKNDIAIYAIHTALDNNLSGVNAKLCEVLGVQHPRILIPKGGTIKKLVAYVPKKEADRVKNALFNAGAGSIGNYADCSFSSSGVGSFKGNEASNPVLGEKGRLQLVPEEQLQLTFGSHLEREVLKALFEHHPYEEVAYEVTTLENKNQNLGMGMVGELDEAMEEAEFLTRVKQRLHCPMVRHSRFRNKTIRRVAVLGGSGAFAIAAAKAARADVLITADLKYHNFFEAAGEILLADVGHFESEQFTKNLLVDFLTEKIPNFAVVLSERITNPVNYF